MEYAPRAIEKKWGEWWKEHQVYRVSNNSDKPKFYILNMFPYPSGSGLHVGHPLGYIASDIVARYKRLRGFNVLNPMGFDAFGLPAEQYAIEVGIHPAVSTDENIRRYRQQLEKLGLGFDWSREIRTCDPKYYKWTQWFFSLFFEHYYDFDAQKALPVSQLVQRLEQEGNLHLNAACDDDTPTITAQEWKAFSEKEKHLFLLRYRLAFPEESFVNWCPALGTVLSNDEVKDGVSERGGYPVERKRMKQWSLRITAYAERLLKGLEEVDWPEAIKEQQRNWIGRSEGALVRFPVQGRDDVFIEVFTTRLDTIYGATFVVLAPEHDLVPQLTTPAQWTEVQSYIKWASSRSERERLAEVKHVTGANTGAFAVNPFTGQPIPIYVADYVLAGYGTGAIMAVPSGDQRDWNFAKAFQLPIIPILSAQKDLDQAADPTKEGRYINSGIINGLTYEEAWPVLLRWLEEKKLGKARVQYKMRNAVFSRQRYWGEPIPIYWKEGVPYLLPSSELPLVLPEIDKYQPTETGEPPLARAQHWRYRPSPEEAYEYEYSTMPGWAGSSWYWYRYMDAHNSEAFCGKEALNYWRKVDWYIGGAEHAVGHLLYSRFWNHFLYDLGLVPEREYAQKLTNQGMIQGRSSILYRAKESFYEEYLWIKVLKPYLDAFGPMRIPKNRAQESFLYDFAFAENDLAIEVVSWKQVDKIELVRRHAEADGKRLLVLFTEELAENINQHEHMAQRIRQALESRQRFFMADTAPDVEQLFVSYELTGKYSPECFSRLYVDIALVNDDVLNLEEARRRPMFQKARFKMGPEGQFRCAYEIEKMSKSKYNAIVPDEVIEQYGADCFRMYEMFLGPIEASKPWDTKGINGVQGFLKRFWSLFFDANGSWLVKEEPPSRPEWRALHTAIKKITEDIERFSLNTCVSQLMILTNELRALKCHKRDILEPALVLLAPFAPHLAEELWHRLGHQTTICDANWPIWEEQYLETDKVIYPVQINGKHRGNIEVDAGAPIQAIEELALRQDFVQRSLGNGQVKKVIVVPGRIVNIVV